LKCWFDEELSRRKANILAGCYSERIALREGLDYRGNRVDEEGVDDAGKRDQPDS